MKSLESFASVSLNMTSTSENRELKKKLTGVTSSVLSKFEPSFFKTRPETSSKDEFKSIKWSELEGITMSIGRAAFYLSIFALFELQTVCSR